MKHILSRAAASLALSFACAASAEQLKIGLVEALSGPAAQTGRMYAEPIKMVLEQINAKGGFNGRPIAIAEYDSQGTPSGASDKFKVAVADGARVIIQSASSAVAGQLMEDVKRYNARNPGKEVLIWNMGSQAYDLTADKCQFWFFRVASNPVINMKALVGAMKEKGVLGDSVYSINQNYSFGQESERAIKQYVAEAGSKVVGSTLHDVNKIQDFSPYVARIKASGAKTALTSNWANDIILLLRAVNDAGLNIRFGLSAFDIPGAVGSAGPGALGYYFVSMYNLDTAGRGQNEYLEGYKAKVGEYPTYFRSQAYWATQLFGEGLRKVDFKGGNIDGKRLALALEDARVETPMGTWSIRKADHQGIFPMVVAEISRDVKYKVDNTDRGFKPVKTLPSETAMVPVDAACKMERP